MNNPAFRKIMENVKNNRDIKLVTTDKRRSNLLSKPNYHTKKHFSGKLMAIKRNKSNVKMSTSVYQGLLILDIGKTAMHKLWYDYVKPKYKKKAKLCYMVTDRFIVYVKSGDIYPDLAEDEKKRFDTSNYEVKRPLSRGKKGRSDE